ncbi:hypothetical protein BH10CYA1_BH10CYA1_58360 [soil metagenome]
MRSASFFDIIQTGWLIALFCVSLAAPGFAQSMDFSRPTPLASVPLVGEFDGSQNISHFYSFDAGPGNILVTYDGHTSKYSTTTQAKLWDANRNSIGQVYLVASTSPSSETKKFNLEKRQRVILETVMNADKDMGILKYSVNISGPVQLARENLSSSSPETAPPIGRPNLPIKGSSGTGKLRIEMRDGNIREFDMAAVRRIIVD